MVQARERLARRQKQTTIDRDTTVRLRICIEARRAVARQARAVHIRVRVVRVRELGQPVLVRVTTTTRRKDQVIRIWDEREVLDKSGREGDNRRDKQQEVIQVCVVDFLFKFN